MTSVLSVPSVWLIELSNVGLGELASAAVASRLVSSGSTEPVDSEASITTGVVAESPGKSLNLGPDELGRESETASYELVWELSITADSVCSGNEGLVTNSFKSPERETSL